MVQGILKHPNGDELRRLLRESQHVAEKYTREALKCAAWPILRAFPVYRDVNPRDAVVARDLILEWIGQHRSEVSG